jgi:hypothetical protein
MQVDILIVFVALQPQPLLTVLSEELTTVSL